MVTKFRVKLLNGRVLGPFKGDEILELIKSKKIDEKVECQYFPAGDWKILESFAEFSVIQEIKDTHSSVEYNQVENSEFQEFDYKTHARSEFLPITNVMEYNYQKNLLHLRHR